MIFRFNTAQLNREMHDSLATVLDALQAVNKGEIDISVVEFPKSFRVRLDDGASVLITWDAEKKIYVGVDEPKPEPESQKDTVDLPKTETDKPVDIDPLELAERTYVQVNDFMRMSLEQRLIYNSEYNRLWSEHK